jgi:3-oxoacyl-[acyl-carrier protein] reductase
MSAADPGFDGRVALVTGGSRGIGAATAAALAERGAAVSVVGRDREALEAVIARIRATGGRAIAAPADCTDAEALRQAVDLTNAELGPVELLAAFAGGSGHPRPAQELQAEEWRRVIEGDLTSAFLTIHTVLPVMLKRKRGSVVTMASSAGRQTGQASAAYAVAKAGVVMLTRHLAAELGQRGIRVNCLAPSAVATEKLTARLTDEQLASLARQFPLGRLGQPSDVAAAAVFLLSDAASWITGVTLDVTGGRVIV